MLSRLLPKPSRFSLLARISSKLQPCPHSHPQIQYPTTTTFTAFRPRFFSSGDDQSRRGTWNLSSETDDKFDPLFETSEDPAESWKREHESPRDTWKLADEKSVSPFFDDGAGTSEEAAAGSRLRGNESHGDTWKLAGEKSDSPLGDEWETAEGFRQWSLGGEEDKGEDLFNGVVSDEASVQLEEDYEAKRIEEAKKLELQERELTAVLKGPDRAFGDLIAASGITDEMLDSLIALKDFEGITGLPPLHEIEDMRYEKNTRKSSRADIERQKQEEVAKARVRLVDDKGRAYGTGRRKCSIARVWISPGDGNFVINDKQFDVYFPMLDHRAAILRPFSETKTLGLWDINCTVQGGGLSGQVGAIRLGVSRALQNWEPDLRPTLKASGFLTRDSRVVERKKPGKAKARKSFQWVKR